MIECKHKNKVTILSHTPIQPSYRDQLTSLLCREKWPLETLPQYELPSPAPESRRHSWTQDYLYQSLQACPILMSASLALLLPPPSFLVRLLVLTLGHLANPRSPPHLKILYVVISAKSLHIYSQALGRRTWTSLGGQYSVHHSEFIISSMEK